MRTASPFARNATRSKKCRAKVRIPAGKAVIDEVFAARPPLRVLAAEKE